MDKFLGPYFLGVCGRNGTHTGEDIDGKALQVLVLWSWILLAEGLN